MMESVSSSERSVSMYQAARCYIPEDHRENLKSHHDAEEIRKAPVKETWVSRVTKCKAVCGHASSGNEVHTASASCENTCAMQVAVL
jgi:hypothetical protein